jgi:hypothetical protein
MDSGRQTDRLIEARMERLIIDLELRGGVSAETDLDTEDNSQSE